MNINILYLLEILDTNKLSLLVQNIDAPFLDLNLAIHDAERDGLVKLDEPKDKITALAEPERTFDADLSNKLIRTMQHYQSKGVNITRGRLNSLVKNPATEFNYLYHDYLCTLQALIDSGQIIEEVMSVPEIKDKRPFKKFVFLCFPDNLENEAWNKKEVNNFIANFNKKK